jgi:hypothetical protein
VLEFTFKVDGSAFGCQPNRKPVRAFLKIYQMCRVVQKKIVNYRFSSVPVLFPKLESVSALGCTSRRGFFGSFFALDEDSEDVSTVYFLSSNVL